MRRIVFATLADFANVREGLLNVVSAGITRVGRPSFPSPMDCNLAVMVEVDIDGPVVTIDFNAVVLDASGASIAEMEGQLSAGVADSPDLEIPTYLPLAVPLPFLIPTEGLYTVVFTVAGLEPERLVFRAAKEAASF